MRLPSLEFDAKSRDDGFVRPADTSPEAWKVYLEAQKRLTPGEKLRRAVGYSTFLRALAEAGLRRRYPQAGEREIFLRAARQRLGLELFHKAYGCELPDDRPAGTGS
jgi:hypothetical protein